MVRLTRWITLQRLRFCTLILLTGIHGLPLGAWAQQIGLSIDHVDVVQGDSTLQCPVTEKVGPCHGLGTVGISCPGCPVAGDLWMSPGLVWLFGSLWTY